MRMSGRGEETVEVTEVRFGTGALWHVRQPFSKQVTQSVEVYYPGPLPPGGAGGEGEEQYEGSQLYASRMSPLEV